VLALTISPAVLALLYLYLACALFWLGRHNVALLLGGQMGISEWLTGVTFVEGLMPALCLHGTTNLSPPPNVSFYLTTPVVLSPSWLANFPRPSMHMQASRA
jgi:hypothetical protein